MACLKIRKPSFVIKIHKAKQQHGFTLCSCSLLSSAKFGLLISVIEDALGDVAKSLLPTPRRGPFLLDDGGRSYLRGTGV